MKVEEEHEYKRRRTKNTNKIGMTRKERGKDPVRHDKVTDRKIRSNEERHVKRDKKIRHGTIERWIDR